MSADFNTEKPALRSGWRFIGPPAAFIPSTSTLAAATDRGQRTNALVAATYAERRREAEALAERLAPASAPVTEDALAGEWELVYASVELFRSSPFFLAIEEAFGDKSKSDLFFKLHLLQVGSWGASTVGRVAQELDFAAGELRSTFDTTLFGLTVIPIVGWFKLLPTFGGRVETLARDLRLEGARLTMEVDSTRVTEVAGLPRIPLLSGLLMDRWYPVGAVWRLLPWNRAPPACSVECLFVDDDMRVMRDAGGGLFVYVRPPDLPADAPAPAP